MCRGRLVAQSRLLVRCRHQKSPAVISFLHLQHYDSMANLGDAKRNAIVQFLLRRSKDGTLQRGDTTLAATHFGCARTTVWRVWKRYEQSIQSGLTGGSVGSRISAKSGRKGYDSNQILVRISKLPYSSRMKIRKMAAALSVSTSVIQRLLKLGSLNDIQTRSNRCFRTAIGWRE
jgi:hypothetical protein